MTQCAKGATDSTVGQKGLLRNHKHVTRHTIAETTHFVAAPPGFTWVVNPPPELYAVVCAQPCERAVNRKQFDLSTSNLVDTGIQCMTVARHALNWGQKVKGQGHQARIQDFTRAGVQST